MSNQKAVFGLFFRALSWGQVLPGEMSNSNWAIVSYTKQEMPRNLVIFEFQSSKINWEHIYKI